MCAGVCEPVRGCMGVGACVLVLSPFASVFYKCGGGGGVLSRHSV